MKVCDIHCHLLPGVDDGPGTMDETVAMLHAAWEGGTRALVATPHLYAGFFPDATLENVRTTFTATVGELGRLAARAEYAFLRQIDLYLGAEHYCDWPFFEALEKGEVLPINDGHHLLVEFPTELPEQAVLAAAMRIVQAGYRPVLAHVERYTFVRENPERLRRFADIGCLAQVNADGSEGIGGSRRLQRLLLKRGLAQVIASDAHSVERRPPDLGPRAARLARGFSEEAVTDWAWHTPSSLL